MRGEPLGGVAGVVGAILAEPLTLRHACAAETLGERESLQFPKPPVDRTVPGAFSRVEKTADCKAKVSASRAPEPAPSPAPAAGWLAWSPSGQRRPREGRSPEPALRSATRARCAL